MAAVVAPLQPGRMVPKTQKGKVAHLSASRKRQPSYEAHQQANSRVDYLVLRPSSQGWSCPTCSQNLARSSNKEAADCCRPFAAATMMEWAQAARSHALP